MTETTTLVVLVTFDGCEWVVYQTADGREEAAAAREDLLVTEGTVDAEVYTWEEAAEMGYVS